MWPLYTLAFVWRFAVIVAAVLVGIYVWHNYGRLIEAAPIGTPHWRLVLTDPELAQTKFGQVEIAVFAADYGAQSEWINENNCEWDRNARMAVRADKRVTY